VWLLRPDGTFWDVDDDFGRPLAPLPVEWHHAAIACGAERYPWLAELVPRRPTDAQPCATCAGQGKLRIAGAIRKTPASCVRIATRAAGSSRNRQQHVTAASHSSSWAAAQAPGSSASMSLSG
jgi:hypothetical protein